MKFKQYKNYLWKVAYNQYEFKILIKKINSKTIITKFLKAGDKSIDEARRIINYLSTF